MATKEIVFTDVQDLARRHPDRFCPPPAEELEEIKTGSYVQISTHTERLWCWVISVNGDQLSGRIDNDLVLTDVHGLQYRDIVTFSRNNVHKIENNE